MVALVATDLNSSKSGVVLGFYCCSCMISLVLLANRLLNLRNKPLMHKIFGNNRTYAVLLIPLSYTTCFCLFTYPVIFNSDHSGWFFYTFAPHHDPRNYYNYPHVVNNVFILAAVCSLSLFYYRSVARFSDIGSGLSTWEQKSLFIQCAIIWCVNTAMSLTHIYIQFFHKPSYIVLIGHVGWQLGHVFPAVAYLFFNSTIQREVLLLFVRDKRRALDQSNVITTF
ncbi:hypothetical protein Y032_0004g1846 [Ancylostoma ceylanicum]|uniref:7TM GPCR serpentine receptor class x (Srx) domain-containing protein n=2 Tax=Ancylostoma ceylanicum TaxID=53326 RepID=A0A016VVX5_9BILA|nr:hypothetical protein Y032_0004g1846 [Ancylostoma ceylanicum]